MDQPNTQRDDDQAALSANAFGYDAETRAYAAGAPHVRHSQLYELFRAQAKAAYSVAAMSLKPGRPLRVLDLGAGDGSATRVWGEHACDVVAVDASARMLATLQQTLRLQGALDVHHVDIDSYLSTSDEAFDVVALVSVVHHIPDYDSLVRKAMERVRVGGTLLTFQDPLRFDTVGRLNRLSERSAYFAWRLGQGNYRRGVETRVRRLRGKYSFNRPEDFEEYHVVRNGVDQLALATTLRERFAQVIVLKYWATYFGTLQRLGTRVGLVSHFSLLAQ